MGIRIKMHSHCGYKKCPLILEVTFEYEVI